MKYSVVIPLYNKEKYIARAIESVLAQTHTDFELIVIDDGSTDGGAAAAEAYADARLRVIRQNNAGVSAARNTGIAAACCDYIGFLDADDAWMPGFLSSMQQLIETFPGAGAYSCCFDSVEKDGSRRSHHARESELQSSRCALINDYFESAMRSYLITSSSVIIPKQVFQKVGAFNPAIRRGEDRDMWRRIALEYPMAYLNEAQAVVYADAQNRACDRAFHLSESAAAFAEEVLRQAKKDGKASPSYEEYMIKLIIVKAELIIAENRCREARELLLRYKYTKRNKKALLRAWLLSFAPQRFRRRGECAA